MIKKWKTDIRDDEVYKRRSRWPRRLRRRSAAARLLRLWARIPPVSRMFVVSVVCCQVEVSATSWSLLKRSPTDCGALLCVGLLLINRPRLRTLPPPHSYGNQRLQRQFDGLLMMGIVMPETCWAVSVRQSNKFYNWLLHLVGCFYLSDWRCTEPQTLNCTLGWIWHFILLRSKNRRRIWSI